LAIHAVKEGAGRPATLFIVATSILYRITLLPASGFDESSVRELLTSADTAPPLGQAVIWALSFLPGEIAADPSFAIRLLTAGADVMALLLLPGLLKSAGLPPALCLIYGWNPLAVKEGAGSARFEILVVLLMALALRAILRNTKLRAAVAYGVSLSGAFSMLALLPGVGRLLGRVAVLGVVLGGAAWGLVILSGTSVWEPLSYVTGSVGGSLVPATAAVFRVLLTRNPVYSFLLWHGVWLAVVVYRASRPALEPSGLPLEALLAMGGLLMVSPQVLPWCFLFLAYLGAFSTNRGWLVFTATAPLSYRALGGGTWDFWLGFSQYFPAYFVLIFGWLGSSRRSQPSREA
jgi:hypothetical protein